MLYGKFLISILSEIRQNIKFQLCHSTISAIQEYFEAYEEQLAALQGVPHPMDLGFHTQLAHFLNDIAARHRRLSLSQLRSQQNLAIVGTAYALLGKCYNHGWFDYPVDHVLAVDYFERSVACKSPIGTFELARCYESGWGTDRDLEQACKLYRASYKLGYIRGLHRYAMILIRGNDFVPRNLLDGIHILKQAAMANDRIYLGFYYDLGMLYRSDTLNDWQYAFEIFTLGASKGCRYCQYKLGEEYETGKIVQKSMDRAFRWYKQSAENGLSDAQQKVAEILYGMKSNTQEDIAKVLEQEGGQVAFYSGNKMERMHTALEFAMAKRRALIDFESYYGSSFERFKEGYKMAMRAATRGHRRAILLVAEALEKGFGVERSLIESLWWYRIAEALGCDTIGEKIYLLEIQTVKMVMRQ